MNDGLYHVTNDHFSAAFRVEDGQVTWCAPILRKRLAYWMTVAERIDHDKDYRHPRAHRVDG
jgi:hypothetical protein